MAKVWWPLLSSQARGKLGNGVVYKRGGVVTKTFTPRNPNSQAQQDQRNYFKEYFSMGFNRTMADLLYAVIGHLHDDRYLQSVPQQDHGGLGGLADDDHTQYHNNTRGDARYLQDAASDGKQYARKNAAWAEVAAAAASDMLSVDTAAEVSITQAVTATISKWHVVTGTTSDYTVTLPAVSGLAGKYLGIRIAQACTKMITIDGNASETIDGELTRVMWAGETAVLKCDGATWQKVAGKFLPMYICVRASSSQINVAGGITKILLDQTDANSGLVLDNANDRVVVRRAGKYRINGQLYLSALAAVGRAICMIYKDNVQQFSAELTRPSSGYIVPQCESFLTLAAAGYIELFMYHDSASVLHSLGAATGAASLLMLQEVSVW